MSKFLKLDKNHKEIVSFLKENGISVYDACRAGNGLTDLITTNSNFDIGFLELKLKKGSVFQRSQIEFMAHFVGAVAFVDNKQDALLFALCPKDASLKPRQKFKLNELLLADKRKKTFTVGEIRRTLMEN